MRVRDRGLAGRDGGGVHSGSRERRRPRAGELRARALELAEIELHAYEPVLEALRLPRDDPGASRARRGRAAPPRRSRRSRSPASAPSWPSWPRTSLAPETRISPATRSPARCSAEAAAQAAARLVAINLTEGSRCQRGDRICPPRAESARGGVKLNKRAQL